MDYYKLIKLIKNVQESTNKKNILLIGSQIIYSKIKDINNDYIIHSMEADLTLYNYKDIDELHKFVDHLNFNFGELSRYHQTYGVYADGVEEFVDFFPKKYKNRLVNFKYDENKYIQALNIKDTIILKLLRMDPKDISFIDYSFKNKLFKEDEIINILDNEYNKNWNLNKNEIINRLYKITKEQIMNKTLTIINENERSGRSYTFTFKTEEIKNEVQKMVLEHYKNDSIMSKIHQINIGALIHTIKSNKDLYDSLEYKILGVDHAVDIIAIMIDKDENKIKIPIIDRKYAPLGFALPGGFVEENDTLIETAKKEFSEELKFNIDSEPTYITKFFEGKDENGNLYDHRGEVTTQGFVFEIPFDSKLEAGDDAAKFKYLEYNLNDGLNYILEKINKESFAMSRHKDILIESIENLDLFKKDLTISR